MVRYALARVHLSEFGSTEPKQAEWYLDKLSEQVPEHHIEVRRYTHGRACFISFDAWKQDKLDPISLKYSVMQQLGADGWEPFAADGSGVWFRKSIG